jgi:hypothetical protein
MDAAQVVPSGELLGGLTDLLGQPGQQFLRGP